MHPNARSVQRARQRGLQAVTADGRSGNDYWHAERVGFRGDWVTGNGQRLMTSLTTTS